MTFLAAGNAVWFLAAGALALLFWWSERQRRRRLERFVGAFADLLRYGPSDRARAWGRRLLVGGAAAMALALMRPTWGFRWVEVPSQGRDLYVLVDISKSMLAQDVAPDRLTWAKRKVIDLAKLAPGHRLGVIAFAGGAYLACPLTSDGAALATILDNLGPESTTSGGTAIGSALELAQSRLKKQGGGAVLLLSDGEDHDGGAESAAAKLGELGVPVYALGVGRPEGAPIPQPGGGFIKGPGGEVVLTRLDEAELTKIATAGKGRYRRSEVGDGDLKEVLADWMGASGEDAAGSGGRKQTPEERFQWPLALALLFWLIEIRLQEGREPAGAYRWRLPWKRGALALLFLSISARASSLDTLYEKGKYEEAEKILLDHQVSRPREPSVLYDLGNTYYREGKFAESERAFGQAAEKLEGAAKQHAVYNRGNAAFRQQRFEDAIGHYETAVALDPKDEDAKYNLALAKKKLQEQQQQKQQQQKDSKQNQDSQKNPDSKQEPQPQDAKNEKGKEKDQDKDKGKEKKGEQAREESGKEKNQSQAKAGEGEAKPGSPMDEQEAQALLERVREFRVKKKPESRKGAPRDGKDW